MAMADPRYLAHRIPPIRAPGSPARAVSEQGVLHVAFWILAGFPMTHLSCWPGPPDARFGMFRQCMVRGVSIMSLEALAAQAGTLW